MSIEIENSAAAGFGHLFKQKMLSRVRRKCLNIPPGLLLPV
jgi:folate-dependent phosphoribosylglycinamide formyltransferase PurN